MALRGTNAAGLANRRSGRGRIDRVLGALAGAAGAMALFGCAIVIRPPQAVVAPVQVFVADYGYHASLVLPDAGGGAVEFAYGHWRWFACNEDQWYCAPGTLLLPGRGTLGRREFDVPASLESVSRQMCVERVHALCVEREDAERLLARLEQRYARSGEAPLHNAKVSLDFVPDEQPYWLWHNCNTEIKEWLRELRCEAHGAALIAEFVVEERPAAAR